MHGNDGLQNHIELAKKRLFIPRRGGTVELCAHRK